MARLFHLVLAVGMAIASAYCGCAAAASVDARRPHPPIRACCRDESPIGATRPDGSTPHDKDHDCPHCRGMAVANPTPPLDAAAFHPSLAAAAFAGPAPPVVGAECATVTRRVDQTSLPPPRSSATLLDLYCSLTV